MPHPLLAAPGEASIPIRLVTTGGLEATLAELPPHAAAFVRATGFDAAPGALRLVSATDGAIHAALFGVAAEGGEPMAPGALSTLLPEGVYRFETPPADPALATLGWLMNAHRFDRYRAPKPRMARLIPPYGVDAADAARIAQAVALGRDLIDTPACDLGPDGLEAAIRALAARHGARVNAVVGEALLTEGFPLIHAVGRAASAPPRLIDLVWGDPDHPKLTLVGKGVCFDTGGLNLKTGDGMALMKKDMGGGASAIAAAAMIMATNLPVRLRLLVPAVENAIGPGAFRAGDVLRSRKGLTVEIGNTDAEGRLILADALALADEEAPEALIDFATLTGAARVALGPDLPPLYGREDAFAEALLAAGRAVDDPVWRMPLWPRYDALLSSTIADVSHISGGSFAGSITAALFLQRFVEKAGAWAHLDIYAWTPKERPGRPAGGEPQGARLVHAWAKRWLAAR